MPYTHCSHSLTDHCESPKECAEFRQCLLRQPPVIAASGSFDGSGAAMPASEAPAPMALPEWAANRAADDIRESVAAGEGGYVEPINPKDQAGSRKVPLGLLPAAGKVVGALACKHGADKYGAYNWRDIPITFSVYLDAIERHLLALRDGEDIAEDSGVHHLGHIIAGASIALDALYIGTLKDDRPKVAGCAANLLKNDSIL